MAKAPNVHLSQLWDKPLAGKKAQIFMRAKGILPQSWVYSCLQDDLSRNNQEFAKEQLSVTKNIK